MPRAHKPKAKAAYPRYDVTKEAPAPVDTRQFRCEGCRYITQGDGPLCRICLSRQGITLPTSQVQPGEGR
jgi:hypothetical protein